MSYQQDVVVIGGGAGGLTSASGLAQLGLKVTLINKESLLGGDCLHTGCVPSKTLIHIAKSAHDIQHAKQFGIEAHDLQFDSSKVMQSVQKVIETIQVHDSTERFEKMGIRVLTGTPEFISSHKIQLNDEIISSKYFIIATGSSPRIPPIPGLDKIDYLTNASFFQLEKLPRTIAIIGGGAIGCELAQALNRLGVQVTLLESGPKLLPFLDPQFSAHVQAKLTSEGISILLCSDIKEITSNEEGKHITLSDQVLIKDAVLIATGRKPNIDGLGLDKIDVAASQLGITINDRCQTTRKHIFAVGDVSSSRFKFTHHAEYQASIVLQNIAFRLPKKMGNAYVPACVYTDPEVATIGLTEQIALEQGYQDIHTIEMPFEDLDRAQTDYDITGMGQLVFHERKLIGVTLMGAHAGDLISEWRHALLGKLKLSDIAQQIHPYPNYAQYNKRIIGRYFSPKVFNPMMKRLVKWLHFKF